MIAAFANPQFPTSGRKMTASDDRSAEPVSVS
jgi:hypothetical protein